MAQIRPFAGIRYRRDIDLSSVIAPPYDVLDDVGKAALQAKHPNNVITVDLPHLPAKTVGPEAAYAKANDTLKAWLSAGILQRDTKPAIYPYTQSYSHGERTFHRHGFFALVKLSPFGQGHVVPHEQTYPDAIQDRLKLTRATQTQLSPIFGLFSDPRHEVTNLITKNSSMPEVTATLDGVRNDFWTVNSGQTINAVSDLMGARPIYIADGHHRYTMSLQYQKEETEKNGGTLPPNHPANFVMFVLVGMQDDGLVILPTHRLIGGLANFDITAFAAAVSPVATVGEVPQGEAEMHRFIDHILPTLPQNSFGLFDGKTRKLHQVLFKDPDVLKNLEPNHSQPWRRLDVAVLQRYLLDEILKPKFAAGKDPTRGYTADSKAVAGMTDNKKYQIALLLKSTPLPALEELGKTNEVMPPKSTFFYPKLATGMVMNALE